MLMTISSSYYERYTQIPVKFIAHEIKWSWRDRGDDTTIHWTQSSGVNTQPIKHN